MSTFVASAKDAWEDFADNVRIEWEVYGLREVTIILGFALFILCPALLLLS